MQQAAAAAGWLTGQACLCSGTGGKELTHLKLSETIITNGVLRHISQEKKTAGSVFPGDKDEN